MLLRSSQGKAELHATSATGNTNSRVSSAEVPEAEIKNRRTRCNNPTNDTDGRHRGANCPIVPFAEFSWPPISNSVQIERTANALTSPWRKIQLAFAKRHISRLVPGNLTARLQPTAVKQQVAQRCLPRTRNARTSCAHRLERALFGNSSRHHVHQKIE